MSSNSAKKKQEEKHLKLLKDLLSIPANKSCFDCNQRGPTYANTTIGSFVCISCSGKLRGLTPPHRVKSVSMASFGMEEIDFLRSRGNQYCRQVWLAHYNIADLGSETKDDQKFKDHLAAKYEKKRWYAEPSSVVNNTYASKVKHEVSTVVEDPPVKFIPTSIPRAPATLQQPTVMKSSDFLADLDFFSPPTNSAAFNPPRKQSPFPQSISQPCFANFQNADFFFPDPTPLKSVSSIPPSSNQIPAGTGMHTSNRLLNMPPKETTSVTSAPVEDRYSALKDLDALFTTQKAEPAPSWASTPWSSTGNQPTQSHQAETNAATRAEPRTAWNTAFPSTASPSNPFLGSSPLQSETVGNMNHGQPALPWANFASIPNGGTTIPSLGVPNANTHYGFNSNPINVASLSSSQSLDLSPKVWGSSAGMNPFMDTTYSKGRSHNPFL